MVKIHNKTNRNNNLITLAEVATKPIPLTDNGKFAYYFMRKAWAKAGADNEPMMPEMTPVAHALTTDDYRVLRKAWQRASAKYDAVIAQRESGRRRYVYELLFAVLKHRRYWRVVLRRRGEKLFDLYELVDRVFGVAHLSRVSRKAAMQELGRWLKNDEKTDRACELMKRSREAAVSFWDRQPLFACAGELECRTLRSNWRHLGRYVSTRSVTAFRRDYWHVGRDGGGQPEIRFAIQHKLPELACRLVYRVGSIDANGGHIHMNCKHDRAIAAQAYDALRHHLSWFRYLAPMTRRRSRWCSVGACGTFADALATKFAAVSASQFERLGTVEVRLWPTSNKPADWRFRARLMQAIARWGDCTTVVIDSTQPVNNAAAPVAWEQFFRWAALNEPETLKEILRVMKVKVRTLNARRVIDRFGAAKCDEFVRQFDASEVRLRGYRRTARPIPAGLAGATLASSEDE
jgi:hypothetical protein